MRNWSGSDFIKIPGVDLEKKFRDLLRGFFYVLHDPLADDMISRPAEGSNEKPVFIVVQ